MRDLFLNECRRFRQAALIAAAIHLLLQVAVARVSDPLQWQWWQHIVALGFYMLCTLGFALYQLGSYRQPGRWVWLHHRPLARGAIFGAIALASCALITFVVGLPALLAVLVEDLGGAHTVDSRHYLLVLQLLLFVYCAWLGGAFIMTSHSRFAAVILALPFLLLVRLASGWTLLPPSLLCVALLAYVVYAGFKPNRLAPPDGSAALATTAVPLLAGFYWALLWGGTLVFQCALLVTQTHPQTMQVAPPGGFTEAARSDAAPGLVTRVAGIDAATAARWRAAMTMPHMPVLPLGRQNPVRHQVSNADNLRWTDERRHIEWTFSHDAMRFEGHDSFTRRASGWLGLHGIGDIKPFPAVPVQPDTNLIMTPQQLLAYDSASGTTTEVMRVPAPETLLNYGLGSPRDRRFVLTNLRLRSIAPGSTVPDDGIALPELLSDLRRIDTVAVAEGTLVTFTFGAHMADGGGDAAQTLMLRAPDGSYRVLTSRALTHDFPLLYEHLRWWPSPLMYTALALPEALFDDGSVPDAGHARHDNALTLARPPAVWLAALLAALATALAGWAWLRPVPMSTRRRAGWLVACLVFGLPALPTLLFLQPRLARARAPRASVAGHSAAVPA